MSQGNLSLPCGWWQSAVVVAPAWGLHRSGAHHHSTSRATSPTATTMSSGHRNVSASIQGERCEQPESISGRMNERVLATGGEPLGTAPRAALRCQQAKQPGHHATRSDGAA